MSLWDKHYSTTDDGSGETSSWFATSGTHETINNSECAYIHVGAFQAMEIRFIVGPQPISSENLVIFRNNAHTDKENRQFRQIPAQNRLRTDDNSIRRGLKCTGT